MAALTDERLRELLEKATPGPWFIGCQNDYPYVIDRKPRPDNDYPNHEADTECIAKPFDARECSANDNGELMALAPELASALLSTRAKVRELELLLRGARIEMAALLEKPTAPITSGSWPETFNLTDRDCLTIAYNMLCAPLTGERS